MHELILNQQHQEFQENTAAAAITLYRNDANVLPWACSHDDNILIIAANDVIATECRETLIQLGFKNINIRLINVETDFTADLKAADKVLLLTYNLVKSDAQLDQIVNRLNQLNKAYVLLSCHNPYDILYVNQARTNILIFGATGVDQTNYSIRRFPLNLRQGIIKLFTATDINQFNQHCPVELI